jgi:hypothetical protein
MDAAELFVLGGMRGEWAGGGAALAGHVVVTDQLDGKSGHSVTVIVEHWS